MAELGDLYQEVILDHNRRPRNFRVLEGANRSAEGFNALCGDRLTVYLDVQDGVVASASFQGSGCAISKASASMMTESVKGRSVAEAEALFQAFHRMVTTPMPVEPETAGLGKLAAFSGVRAFPARVKCASLPWHTLRAALEARRGEASTE